MNKELIIDVNSDEVSIALLEDKVLTELNKEKRDNKFSVGDLYLAKVRKTIPGLNAAFVDVGHEKDAFLHYLDLGPQVKSLNKYVKIASTSKKELIPIESFNNEPDIDKNGKINDVLSANQYIMVQIAKEPIGSKGPRITSEIAFAGRYVVAVPFSNRVSVSKKIKDAEERNRLKRLVQSIKPENFGIIVRTVAENKKVADLVKDIEDLKKKWDTAIERLSANKAPLNVLREMDRTSTILRDLLSPSFNSIHINNKDLMDELKNYLQSIAPDRIDMLKLYTGKVPIFENFGIDKQIKSSFGKKVTMQSGAYLIIEHTEAMHVIDVNSGHRLKNDNNQESNALETNLVSAKEIARQLRLRDMGGIIVIDFIDMVDKENRRILFEKMKEEMSHDSAKHTIIPPSKFGLIQITRQRVRPEMSLEINEQCPVCQGTGEVKATVLLIDEIQNNIRYLTQEQNEANLELFTHPFIHAFLKRGFLKNYQWKWYRMFKKWIKIKPASSYHLLEYHFFNKEGDEIKI